MTPGRTRDAFEALRVPRVVPKDAAANALPWVEIALALLLLISPSGWLVPVTLALALLMLAYAVAGRPGTELRRAGDVLVLRPPGRHDVNRTMLARNVLLVGLAAAAVWFAAEGGSAPAAFADLDSDGWWSLGATAASAAVAVLVVGVPPGPDRVADEELLDYDRRPIPYGVLALADGRTATLAELAATQARLLVVLNPACGPCIRIAERLDGWAAELTPAVGVVAIYPTAESASGAVEHDPELATWEPERNVRRVFSVGTPAAILLGADGFLAGGPVAGERAVAGFVADVLAEVSAQPFVGE